jgi:YHS domain-containing protein
MRYVKWLCFGVMTIAVVLAGCSRSGAPKVETISGRPDGAEAHANGAHTAHGTGPNGGVIFDLGAFHAEILINHENNEATVLILTPEDNKPARIVADVLTLTTRETKTRQGRAVPRVTVQLVAQDKSDGTASRFVGRDAGLGAVADLEGSVAGLINGKPALGEFKNPSDALAHVRHGEVPESVSGTPAERELFLTPGGIYTSADIMANGNTLPSLKFRDISWPHDDDLKPGDKVCPVTANKADSRCHWIVNGKTYEFCCTPCLDKFVKWAKQDPKKVKEPDSYIQK